MTTDVIILKNTLRIYDSFSFTSYFDIFKAKKRVAKFLGPTKILSNETNPCSYLNGVNTKLISCYVLKVNNKDIRTRSIVVILMYLILAIKNLLHIPLVLSLLNFHNATASWVQNNSTLTKINNYKTRPAS